MDDVVVVVVVVDVVVDDVVVVVLCVRCECVVAVAVAAESMSFVLRPSSDVRRSDSGPVQLDKFVNNHIIIFLFVLI